MTRRFTSAVGFEPVPRGKTQGLRGNGNNKREGVCPRTRPGNKGRGKNREGCGRREIMLREKESAEDFKKREEGRIGGEGGKEEGREREGGGERGGGRERKEVGGGEKRGG